MGLSSSPGKLRWPTAPPGIYLDANGSYPVCSAVREWLVQQASTDSLGAYNASSTHRSGRYARGLLQIAREQIGRSLGTAQGSDLEVDPARVLFTSSGLEANQWAIRAGIAQALQRGIKPHWITTVVEHDSVRKMERWVRAQGGEVSHLSIDSAGAPRVEELTAMVRPETALVSVIWANNETGVISDVRTLGRLCRELCVPLHLDGVQAWGKLALERVDFDYLSLSSHKIGGLPGTGVLVLGPKLDPRLEPLFLGTQEGGLRGGTENLWGIVAAGLASTCVQPAEWANSVAPVRDWLEAEVRKIPGALINGVKSAPEVSNETLGSSSLPEEGDGGASPRIANTLNVNFIGVEGEGLVAALDLAGYAVSAGSACASGAIGGSPVLRALGRSEGLARAGLRISLSLPLVEKVRRADLTQFVETLDRLVRVRQRLRGMNGVPIHESLVNA